MSTQHQMSPEGRRALERAIWRARWDGIRKAAVPLGLAAVMLGVMTFLQASPTHVVATLHGEVITAPDPNTANRKAIPRVTIKLDDGEVAVVPVATAREYAKGERLTVQKLQNDWPPHRTHWQIVHEAPAKGPAKG